MCNTFEFTYRFPNTCTNDHIAKKNVTIDGPGSNRGEGDEPLLRIGRVTRMPLQGAVDVVPLLGAIAGCHCSVLWLSGRGAIAGCHCRVPL